MVTRAGQIAKLADELCAMKPNKSYKRGVQDLKKALVSQVPKSTDLINSHRVKRAAVTLLAMNTDPAYCTGVIALASHLMTDRQVRELPEGTRVVRRKIASRV